MDTMSYEEFERMPLFHMKGIMPRGKYLFTQVKMDADPLNKSDYMYECIKTRKVRVMNVTEEPPEPGTMLPTIQSKLETYAVDFSDLDRWHAQFKDGTFG